MVSCQDAEQRLAVCVRGNEQGGMQPEGSQHFLDVLWLHCQDHNVRSTRQFQDIGGAANERDNKWSGTDSRRNTAQKIASVHYIENPKCQSTNTNSTGTNPILTNI